MLRSAIVAFFLAMTALPALAQSNLDDQFRNWLENDVWPQAKSAGISRGTFQGAFKDVQPNPKLPDIILPGAKPETPKAQHQAEFNAPSRYFAEKTVGAVSAGGRSRAKRLGKLLASIEKRYGVPAGIVLAIWGRESGFGAAKMPYDAFEVLGTKAWLARRKDMFRAELIAALQLVEKGVASRQAMRSSWAGALGQPQFLPTSVHKHGVDFDRDGKIDIWKSEPDTLASIAKYLADYGWEAGREWGYEVRLPQDLSCALEGPDQGRKISDWISLGVSRVSAKPFPDKELAKEGFLLMPAGRNGPAFIVSRNFYVLKEYNESDLYALFIGHAADRIAGSDKSFSGKWGKVDTLYRSDIAQMQRNLEAQGYDVGGADGLPGFKTRRSIGKWQEKQGMAATCFPSAELVKRLR
ncbi:MAG: lytic murein transglycosylase [Rhizobiaceae bacterium]|nr:lytic murein transglycosylase [Rhizobiaceae bacterium]